MTTPERLRARQRRESIMVAILAFGLVLATLYFHHEDMQQRRCFTAFIANTADTAAKRSYALEIESDATRAVILGGLSAQSRGDVRAAKRTYKQALVRVDNQRRRNPVQPFVKGTCDL